MQVLAPGFGQHAAPEIRDQPPLCTKCGLECDVLKSKLVSKTQLSDMKRGAAIVDVAIDQGGCFETSKATTHQDPIYEVDGIMHYCVANMPGAVARTATLALSNATLPYMLTLADKGWRDAVADDPHLRAGLNVHAGKLTYRAVGEALGLPVTDTDLLAA